MLRWVWRVVWSNTIRNEYIRGCSEGSSRKQVKQERTGWRVSGAPRKGKKIKQRIR